MQHLFVRQCRRDKSVILALSLSLSPEFKLYWNYKNMFSEIVLQVMHFWQRIASGHILDLECHHVPT
jgi:hypothetical protein